MALYPANLKITGRLCIVVGGGSVACRKVKRLVECGADIRIISPLVEPELSEIIREKSLEWFAREYVDGDLRGAFLAFALTDAPAVQNRLKEEAAKYTVMFNSADDPAGCDFHVPAHFRRGDMLVTVSTSGGSPALSKQIRERLEGEIGAEYEAVVGLMTLIRSLIVGRAESYAEEHKDLFQNLLKIDIVGLIREGKWFDLQMHLLQELPQDIDSVALIRRFLDMYDKK